MTIKLNDIYASPESPHELYCIKAISDNGIRFNLIKDRRETNIDWLTRKGRLVDMHQHELTKLQNPPVIKPRMTINEFNQKYQIHHLVANPLTSELSIDEIKPNQPEEKIIMTRKLDAYQTPKVTEIGRIFIQEHNLNFNELLTDVQYLR